MLLRRFYNTAQDITKNAGVSISQTVSSVTVTGTLKTALTGSGMTTVFIETISGTAFVTTADLVIGGTTVVHANINAATNNGATTTVVVQALSGITFVSNVNVVIGTDEYTLGITAQDITKSVGVTVTQGVGSGAVTGTLKTALTGTGMTSVVIETVAGVVFVNTANVVIDTDVTVVLANIATATKTKSAATVLLASITSATNSLSTSSVVIQALPGVSFVSTTNVVIGGTTVVSANINTATHSNSATGSLQVALTGAAVIRLIVSSADTETFTTTTDLMLAVDYESTLTIASQTITESVGVVVSQNEWTLTITAQVITESAGVTVTQGSVTGTLKTALTGAGTISVVVSTAAGTTFVTGVDVDVGGTTINHATITTATNSVSNSGTLKTALTGASMTNVVIQTVAGVNFVDNANVVIGGREWTLAITAQGITESPGVTVTQGSVTGTLKTALQNQWTLTIGAADITASVGVTVTQGSVTGTLATALTGAGMTSVVINTASGVVFADSADTVIAAAGGDVSISNLVTTGAANNGATTSVVIKTAAKETFLNSVDVVIGSTTAVHGNIATSTKSKSESVVLLANVNTVVNNGGLFTVAKADLTNVNLVEHVAANEIQAGSFKLSMIYGSNQITKNQWILTIASQTITESSGVTVTQGTVTGTLKTALIGATTSVVIETADGVTFATDADVIIGSTTVAFANINTAANSRSDIGTGGTMITTNCLQWNAPEHFIESEFAKALTSKWTKCAHQGQKCIPGQGSSVHNADEGITTHSGTTLSVTWEKVIVRRVCVQVEAHTGEVIYVLNDNNQEISYESDISIHVGDSFTCDDAYFNFIDPCYGMSSSVVKICEWLPIPVQVKRTTEIDTWNSLVGMSYDLLMTSIGKLTYIL